jgi:hypothetical protein
LAVRTAVHLQGRWRERETPYQTRQAGQPRAEVKKSITDRETRPANRIRTNAVTARRRRRFRSAAARDRRTYSRTAGSIWVSGRARRSLPSARGLARLEQQLREPSFTLPACSLLRDARADGQELAVAGEPLGQARPAAQQRLVGRAHDRPFLAVRTAGHEQTGLHKGLDQGGLLRRCGKNLSVGRLQDERFFSAVAHRDQRLENPGRASWTVRASRANTSSARRASAPSMPPSCS